jgi:maltodextrin utilization protein YvdJ
MEDYKEIDEAISSIEADFVEYSNGSKNLKATQDMQRFVILDLINNQTKALEEKLAEQLKNHEVKIGVAAKTVSRMEEKLEVAVEFMEIRLDNLNNSKDYNRSNYKTTEHQRLEEALEKIKAK